MANPALRTSWPSSSFSLKLIAASVFLLLTLSLLFASSTDPSDFKLGFSSGRLIRGRAVLAIKSDPLKPRLDQIRKQAEDHRSLVLAYASYARKLKLENSKLVRIFAVLSRNYTDLISKPPYRALFDSDTSSIDESALRKLEKEVKERIKVARQVIAEAKDVGK